MHINDKFFVQSDLPQAHWEVARLTKPPRDLEATVFPKRAVISGSPDDEDDDRDGESSDEDNEGRKMGRE